MHVGAPAGEIFALIVDPHRPPEIDGSGTMRDAEKCAVKGPHHLSEGDKFTVGMTQYGLPYKITSTATEVEENRVVEWAAPVSESTLTSLADRFDVHYCANVDGLQPLPDGSAPSDGGDHVCDCARGQFVGASGS